MVARKSLADLVQDSHIYIYIYYGIINANQRLVYCLTSGYILYPRLMHFANELYSLEDSPQRHYGSSGPSETTPLQLPADPARPPHPNEMYVY